MKNTIILLLLLALSYGWCRAQGTDSVQAPKYKKVFPGLTLGAHRVGFWTGEAGLLLGFTNNKLEQTKIMSMILHGPSLGCEMGRYENAFRVAPKLSYGYYTSFLAGKVSLVDYMKNEDHNLYISPEAGLSFGSFLDLFAGANFLVSGNEIPDVKTFRLTLSINLLFFYFGKGK